MHSADEPMTANSEFASTQQAEGPCIDVPGLRCDEGLAGPEIYDQGAAGPPPQRYGSPPILISMLLQRLSIIVHVLFKDICYAPIMFSYCRCIFMFYLISL